MLILQNPLETSNNIHHSWQNLTFHCRWERQNFTLLWIIIELAPAPNSPLESYSINALLVQLVLFASLMNKKCTSGDVHPWIRANKLQWHKICESYQNGECFQASRSRHGWIHGQFFYKACDVHCWPLEVGKDFGRCLRRYVKHLIIKLFYPFLYVLFGKNLLWVGEIV